MSPKIFDTIMRNVEQHVGLHDDPEAGRPPDAPKMELERLGEVIGELRALAENGVFTKEGRALFGDAAKMLERTILVYGALEPFADIAGEGDEDYPDDTKVVVHFGRTTNYALTLGDFRRAMSVFAASRGADPNGINDLVDRFAAALKEKLHAAERKYGYSNDWKHDHWRAELIACLHEHVEKGDPRDVAAYCAFAWHHGWSLKP